MEKDGISRAYVAMTSRSGIRYREVHPEMATPHVALGQSQEEADDIAGTFDASVHKACTTSRHLIGYFVNNYRDVVVVTGGDTIAEIPCGTDFPPVRTQNETLVGQVEELLGQSGITLLLSAR